MPVSLVFALIAAAVAALTPLAMTYAAHRGLFDVAGPRRSHEGAIPRGGGVVATLALIAGWFVLSPAISAVPAAAALLIVGLVGWIDDHRPLSAVLRLAIQAAAVLLLLFSWWGYSVLSWPATLPGVFAVILALASPVLAVGLINAWNFMDGSHGLAAGEALFVGAACLLLWPPETAVAAAGGVMAAAALGFLPWNFPRPRVFMGDVASLAFGLQAAYLVLLAGWPGGLAVLLLTLGFAVDTGMTLLLRLARRADWSASHREHLYQRLLQHGFSHTAVWFFLMALNVVLLLPLAVLANARPQYTVAIFLGAASLLAALWMVAVRRLPIVTDG